MKTLQTYQIIALFLLGLLLISGCRQTENPTAPDATPPYAGEQSLLKVTGSPPDAACFRLAQSLDRANLRAAEGSAEEIKVVGNTTIYVGAGWSQSFPTITENVRRTVTPTSVRWANAISHIEIVYTTDGTAQALVRAWAQGEPNPGRLVCSTF